METSVRTINTGIILSKEYFESLGIILSTYMNLGYVGHKAVTDWRKVTGKLEVYGYSSINNPPKLVYTLYKIV